MELSDLRLQKEEAEDAKWVNKEELLQMIEEEVIIPYHFIDRVFEWKDVRDGIAKKG